MAESSLNAWKTLREKEKLETIIPSLIKMAESSLNAWKTLWEKEKLLVTSNFSFSHSFFSRRVLQTRKDHGLFGKGLISVH